MQKKIPLVYIAGPYRAKDGWELERNIRAAEERAFFVATAGGAPACPHSMFRFFDRTLTDEYWIAATLRMLMACDAIWVAADWRGSEGTIGEFEYARDHNMPTFFSAETCLAWLQCEL